MEGGDGSNEERRMMKVPNSRVVEFFRETDTKEIVRKSEMFQGIEFLVVNVDEGVCNKVYLESRIAEHGGKRVQNLLPSTTHIIASRLDFKVKTIIDTYHMSIVHFQWILACIERGFLIDLEP